MGINDIFDLLEQFDIASNVDGDKISFIDKNSGKTMTIIETGKKELPLITLDVDCFFTLFIEEPARMFRVTIKRPLILKSKEEDFSPIITHIDCGDLKEEHVVSLNSPANCGIRVRSYVKENEIYVYSEEIDIRKEGLIFFTINDRFGAYDNGFNESFELNKNEMLEVLNSNKMLPIVLEYYGKLYPELISTVEKAKQSGLKK